MADYIYKCGSCGCQATITRSMRDGPVPSFSCACGKGNMMDRVWMAPEVIVKGFHGNTRLKLPGINLAAYKRSNEAQEQLYTKTVNYKRHRDMRERNARGTSRKRNKGRLFRRTGSMPRELLVAEARSNGVAAGTLLKEKGNDLFKRHGCDWSV